MHPGMVVYLIFINLLWIWNASSRTRNATSSRYVSSWTRNATLIAANVYWRSNVWRSNAWRANALKYNVPWSTCRANALRSNVPWSTNAWIDAWRSNVSWPTNVRIDARRTNALRSNVSWINAWKGKII